MFILLHGAAIGWAILGCAMVLAAFARRAAPWRIRARYAAIAGLATPALGYALARALLFVTAVHPDGTGAWIASQVAAVSPLRARGLERARLVLAGRILRVVPTPGPPADLDVRSAMAVGGPTVDHRTIARYVELSRLESDCSDAAQFLAGVAIDAPDATMDAANAAMSCGRKTDVENIATQRVQASDFEGASRVYDHAALRWTANEPDDIFAAPLLRMRYQNEVWAHFSAGELPRAANALVRFERAAPADKQPRIDCARWAIAAIDGDAAARAKLEESSEDACAFELAALTDRAQRAPLVKRLGKSSLQIVHLYVLRAWNADDVLDSSTTWDTASSATQWLRPSSPHALLAFPYSARVGAPGVLLATLARLNAATPLTRPLQLARARYRATAARFESSLGEHDAARKDADGALEDYRALVTGAGPKTYETRAVDVELAQATVLVAAIELVAGDVERAGAVLRTLPVWTAASVTDDVEKANAQASSDAVAAYVALFRGDAGPLERFAGSDECTELSDGFVIRQELEKLKQAARGDAASCDDIACLVAARQPATGAALRAKLDHAINLMGVEREPGLRLVAIGEARRLALATHDVRFDAAFARWLAALRPRALDPRLAALAAELGAMFH